MADNQVFVGVPDVQIEEEDDNICSWSTNKFGGRPNWMFSLTDEYPLCKLCRRKLFLVSQIYCPLSDSEYHRTLYIFGCVNHSCCNKPQSWTILRSQDKTNEHKTTSSNQAPIATKSSSVDDWGVDAGDWGDADECNDSLVSDLEYVASKLSLNPSDEENGATETLVCSDSSAKPLQPNYIHQEVPFFQPYYTNVFEYETTRTNTVTAGESLTKHEKELLSHYQEQEGMILEDVLSLRTQSNTKKHERVMEGYEKVMVAHGDRGFHKFQKYLQHCPQQCIRYEWNGKPLSMSSSDTPSDIISAVPTCQYCGSQRVYELQLMPALIVLLKIKESFQERVAPVVSSTSLINERISNTEVVSGRKKPNEETVLAEGIPVSQGIEFGTVIVFSCSKSCWNDLYGSCTLREEVAVVHADPDAEFFRK